MDQYETAGQLAKDLTAKSRLSQEIVTVPYDRLLAEELVLMCEGDAISDTHYEYWGSGLSYQDDGAEWRLHLLRDHECERAQAQNPERYQWD